jgi:hypothetical protein
LSKNPIFAQDYSGTALEPFNRFSAVFDKMKPQPQPRPADPYDQRRLQRVAQSGTIIGGASPAPQPAAGSDFSSKTLGAG